MTRHRFTLTAALAAIVLPAFARAQAPAAAPAPSAVRQSANTLPSALSDDEFWRLSNALSEPNGYFQSDNLVGNERPMQYVVPALEALRRGGVYLGVAPDQNFTYILALQPKIAFIVDIRRGNLLEHLMYKAVIELSADRSEFLSRLFSRAQPKDLDVAGASVGALFEAYRDSPPNEALYASNLAAIQRHLTKTHGFALSGEDLSGLAGIYQMFFRFGPALNYRSSGLAGGGMNMPSYADMMQLGDLTGAQHSYLATESAFQALRSYERRNLIVPVVGDFAGPKALRAVGEYLRDHGAVVTAFYTSNVEQYLFRNGVAADFYRNVATLPIDDASVFIRSAAGNNVLDPIGALLKEVDAGRVTVYGDVTIRGIR